LNKARVAVLRLKRVSRERYGNAHHQGVAYVDLLKIRLPRALGTNVLINIFIIMVAYVVVEIYAFFAEILR
jgi:hypothetical protein